MSANPATHLAEVIRDYQTNVEPYFLAKQTDAGAAAVDRWVNRWGEATVRAAMAVMETQFELKRISRR